MLSVDKLRCKIKLTFTFYFFLPPGDCLLLSGYTAPQCVCHHGFDSLDCSICTTNFVGSDCELCKDDYIGYNTTCDVFCANGQATQLGKFLYISVLMDRLHN